RMRFDAIPFGRGYASTTRMCIARLLVFLACLGACLGACRRATPTSGEPIHAETVADADAAAEADADAAETDDDAFGAANDGDVEDVRTATPMEGPFADHADVCKHATVACRMRVAAALADAGSDAWIA